MTVVDTVARYNAEYGQRDAECAKSRRWRQGGPVWRGSKEAEENTAFGKRWKMSRQLKKNHSSEREGRYLLEQGMCLSLEQLLKAADKQKDGIVCTKLVSLDAG